MTTDNDSAPVAPAVDARVRDWQEQPADLRSTAALSERGLDYRVLTAGPAAPDTALFDDWVQAVARGFQDGEYDEPRLAASREGSALRRRTGVYDPVAPMAGTPVGTLGSWVAELTLPGERAVAACAITAVTVAPTHRRRGIARAMVEGELRTAAAAGLPAAMLTVSESTIYGRYGFAPAGAAADWEIETKRLRWTGPVPDGRVDFIPRERLRSLLPGVHERVRLRYPGEIEVAPGLWDRFAGTRADVKDAGAIRAVQYTDADGEVQGLASFKISEDTAGDGTKGTVDVSYFLAATDDAYAALWRFLLELDLIATLRAHQQSADEPLLWMIDDQRAVTLALRDHQYVRILDVPAVLGARRYAAPGRFALDVDDPLGIAGGRFLLEVAPDGTATLRALAAGEQADAVAVSLGIRELGAIVLGGVSPETLARAGLVRSSDAAALARTFWWHTAPRLSLWY
ncbi:GNAT family N-acetyltransferase [Microbacterium sp. zg.Y1090]|uniref:GNAT family N-acetyltransferase n=1 Tax=Microbacterium TaxID=33882 RepID=UPI00214C6B4B|nr:MULTISPECIES: GNAT family N-acetyltransferase [unclassified Microbacterium]MCR2812220.1 GNAT family N-acetyltransferase [Microbacterium sp. zg.Y1084]MCR2818342.1 GNAT family N-acetyltransferase [Microbacterium sp. zg.Y1090]MDL5486154.1 GNAT family N-acetyltransferase [Microbacterium sp. zg-Y1211]WIM29362.1 GNAT family N-acetyltransferase [Microbacterium sp. zg-Y1090]